MYEVSIFNLKPVTPIQLDTLYQFFSTIFRKKVMAIWKRNQNFFLDIAKSRINFWKKNIFSESANKELAFMQNQQNSNEFVFYEKFLWFFRGNFLGSCKMKTEKFFAGIWPKEKSTLSKIIKILRNIKIKRIATRYTQHGIYTALGDKIKFNYRKTDTLKSCIPKSA